MYGPLSRSHALALPDDAMQLLDVTIQKFGGLAFVVHDVPHGHALVGIKRDADDARMHFA